MLNFFKSFFDTTDINDLSESLHAQKYITKCLTIINDAFSDLTSNDASDLELNVLDRVYGVMPELKRLSTESEQFTDLYKTLYQMMANIVDRYKHIDDTEDSKSYESESSDVYSDVDISNIPLDDLVKVATQLELHPSEFGYSDESIGKKFKDEYYKNDIENCKLYMYKWLSDDPEELRKAFDSLEISTKLNILDNVNKKE